MTTPEKWDVVTRKGGDGSLVSSVGLIMIDEASGKLRVVELEFQFVGVFRAAPSQEDSVYPLVSSELRCRPAGRLSITFLGLSTRGYAWRLACHSVNSTPCVCCTWKCKLFTPLATGSGRRNPYTQFIDSLPVRISVSRV